MDGDAVNKGLHPPFWTTLGGPCVPGVAIGFEIGVGMATFALEESGWELGGLGFRSQLAINNSKYLICNRNHNSQKLTMRASSLHA